MTTIYFLVDPRDPAKVRYVGQTKTPRVRHLQHCAETAGSPKGVWIETLRQVGIMPQMVEVQSVDDSSANSVEALWIKRVAPDFLTNSSVARHHASETIDLPLIESAAQSTVDLLADTERKAIAQAMTAAKGNKLKAAKLLGIGRQTLYNKLRA